MRRARLSLLAGLAATAAASAMAQTPPAAHVDDPGKLPAPPPSASDVAYDARIAASADAAEQFQGPLDGGWTLAAAGEGGDLYGFELVDRRDRLEGAWRDLRRTGVAGSGFLDRLTRSPKSVEMAFASPDGPTTVTLRPVGDAFRGELRQNGRRTQVVMRRATRPSR